MRPLQEYIDELRSLDQHNIGSWPTWAYGFAMALVSLLIVLIAAWYFVLPKRNAVIQAMQQEATLRQTFKQKESEVANLGALENQLAEMHKEFGVMLAQLPSQTEVPSLLRDISQARASNGLDERLFKPEAPVNQDFYAKLPNDLVVTGDFHQFGRFVSDVAALPRIVTIHDIKIEPVAKNAGSKSSGDGDGPLQMSLTATTYRYLDDTNSASASTATTTQKASP